MVVVGNKLKPHRIEFLNISRLNKTVTVSVEQTLLQEKNEMSPNKAFKFVVLASTLVVFAISVLTFTAWSETNDAVFHMLGKEI